MSVDLFGNETPQDTLTYQVTNDPDQVQAVLRIAHTDGYAVTGRRCEQIWRLTGHREVAAVPGYEAETVRQLIDHGWLQIGGSHQYYHRDGPDDVDANAVLVPTSTRKKLTYWAGLRTGRGGSRGAGGHQ